MAVNDNAYKFGYSRYVQGWGVLTVSGEEVLRLHRKKPVIIGGPTALSVALDCLKNGTVTHAFEKIVYINLAVAGIISGIAKGFGQTAFAHEFYEAVRTVFTREAAAYIHGELVGIALAVQLDYNGDEEQIPALRQMLTDCGLPVKLKDANIPATQGSIRLLVEDMKESQSMKEAGPEGEPKLYKAMQQLM